PALHAVERRLRDEEVPSLDHLLEVAVEEREEQRADVRAVDVRVAHEDDRVVAELGELLVLRADPGAERRDEELDLLRRQHLVEACLLDVQDLAAEREDRLVLPVAALLRGAAGGVALDDEELRERGIPLLAVGELPGKRSAVERPLAAREVLRLAGGLPHPGGLDALE